MRVDGTLRGLADATTRARALEAAGHDGVWAGELNGDPFLPLVLAAEATERVALGTSIAVAFARSPMTLAYTADDLQRHSGGRLLLGLGSQVRAHVRRRFDMPWDAPAARMREYVLALRAIWASWHGADGRPGPPLDFRGERYTHTLMPPDFVPPPHDHGPPRVLIAGVGERMTAVAGEVADGFLCHGFTTAAWIRSSTLPALRAARGDLAGFDVVGTPFVLTGTDEQIAAGVERVRARIAFYASTPAYRGIFELHGWDGVDEQLTALSKAGRWADMAALVTDDMVDELAVVAPVADLPGRLVARFGGLLTRLSLSLPAELAAGEAADVVRRVREAAISRTSGPQAP